MRVGGRARALFGRVAHRWRWAVLAGWFALAVAGGVLLVVYPAAGPAPATGPASESTIAAERVAALRPEGGVIIAVITSPDPYAPALVASVAGVAADLGTVPGVRSVHTPYTGGLATVRVELSDRLPPAELARLVDRVTAALHGIDAPHVLVGGPLPTARALADQAVRDATIGTALAVLAALVVLLLVARGSPRARLATAAGPQAAALVTAVAALAAIRLAGPGPRPTVVALLGLTLAVGYALAVLEAYRADPRATVGRPVLGAATLVGAVLAGVAVLGEPALAAAGGAVVLVATAAALTLVPAVIAVGGGRIPPPVPPAVFGRLGSFARRRAAPTTLALTIGLLLLAAPFLDGSLTDPDARSLPAPAEARQVDEALRAAAGPGADEIVTVVIEAPPASSAVRDYLNDLERLDGVTTVRPRPDLGDRAAVVDLAVAEADGRRLVRAIRALKPPFPTLVGGAAARVVDVEDRLLGRLPWAALIVVVVGMIVLSWLSGSVVTPAPALALSGLTLLATLGVLVVVFPWGLGEAVLGLDPRALAVTTPLLLAPIVFGLSLSHHALRRGDPPAAGGLVVAALGLAFLVSGLAGGREVAVGVAVAALVDLTVVRGLLVPAIHQLLGDRIGWRPRLSRSRR